MQSAPNEPHIAKFKGKKKKNGMRVVCRTGISNPKSWFYARSDTCLTPEPGSSTAAEGEAMIAHGNPSARMEGISRAGRAFGDLGASAGHLRAAIHVIPSHYEPV